MKTLGNPDSAAPRGGARSRQSATTRSYDVVVVGASFAGLSFARTAALRGLGVLVLERRSAPGVRLHTTGILVKEAAELLDVPAALTRVVPGVRLYGSTLQATDLHRPGYWFLATDTPRLMEWLCEEARRAGAEFRFFTPFVSARREDGWIHLPGDGVRCRYLVGADGAHSRVARCFDLGRNRRFLTGVEAEYPGACGLDPRFLHCLMSPQLAPGYIAWAVPGVGITQVGLACTHPRKPRLEHWLAKLRRELGFAGREPCGFRAGSIPVGGPVSPIASDGVLLIGDAAGLVSPLTGGGIANALRFGRRAGQLVADFLAGHGPEPSCVLAREQPDYRVKRALRALLSTVPPAWPLDLLLHSAPGRALARNLFFHARWPRPEPTPPGRAFRAAAGAGISTSVAGMAGPTGRG